MTQSILEKLNSFKNKKVEIHLHSGEKMRCIPKEYLIDEDVTYLVDTYESYGSYPANMLVELTEEEIKIVIPI